MEIEFYPLDIDYDNNSVIKLIGTTKDGKKACVYDDSFRPYFWIFNDDVDKIKDKISKISNNIENIYVTNVEVHNKNYLNKEVKALKVFYNNPRGLRFILDELNDFGIEKKEIDINFAKRYLIDKNITMMTLTKIDGEVINDENFDYCIKGIVKQESQEFYDNPKVLAVDIEVYGSAGGEDKVKNDPILMIGLLSKDIKKVITWKKFKAQDYVEFVNSEAEMIEKFIEIVKNYKPDIIIGYNSDSFDFPYIKARAEKYGIKLNLGSDNSNLRFTPGLQNNVKINGIIHLDLLKFIRKIMAANLQLDSYSLDSVAKELLQQGKKEVEIDIVEAWDNIKDLEKFSEYNLHDVELTLEIFDKIFPIMVEIVKLTNMPLFDISRISYGQLVESYLIKRAGDFNEILPNKPMHEDISERRLATYQGAFVMEPKIGFYNDVAFFDFRSLYPSIIVAKNIYPGNLNSNKEGYETPEITDENGNKKIYYFNTKREGFIPEVVRDLIIRRNRIKEIMKTEDNVTLKARSYALKTIANSTYGMYGFFGARYYSKECASSITAFGRQYIKDAIKKAEEEDFLVIYSDTDSLSVTLGNKTKKDALNFLKKINIELPSLMELELEGFYPRGIFVSKKGETQGAKKKYALIDENGKIKITGFETIRKDWSIIVREVQLKVIEMILKEGKHENALDYVRKIIKEIKDKKIDLKKMVIKEQLKMPLESYKQIGPHVAVARRMKLLGMDTSPGTNIYFIVSNEPGIIRDKARIPSECNDYDANYYIENQIMPSVEKIFEVFGITKDQVLIQEQSKLGDF